MNVWMMLWLTNSAARAKEEVTLLSVDALRLYNNNYDVISDFFDPYFRSFKTVLTGADFKGKKVCFEKLIVQAIPPTGFVWDGWHTDAPCSLIGPSSLFQRFNLHNRYSYGLLNAHGNNSSNEVRVVLIVRTETFNDWGSYRTSRLFLNLDMITQAIDSVLNSFASTSPSPSSSISFSLEVVDLAKLPSFASQIDLIARRTNILVGMHGAGIVSAMFMSVGTPRCCGVLEIFPEGEFTPARGYGNMVRQMGLHYRRIDIGHEGSKTHGAIVPVEDLKINLLSLLQDVINKPSCILDNVINNPYLEFSEN
jgi:hypothetical protein